MPNKIFSLLSISSPPPRHRHSQFAADQFIRLCFLLGCLFPLVIAAQPGDQSSPLRGLKTMSLKINEFDRDPTIDMVIRENLRFSLTESLQQAGLMVVAPEYADYLPELEITKRVVSINNFTVAAINIELIQWAAVLCHPEKNATQRVVTWKRATMGLFPVQSPEQAVRSVGQHIEAFIQEYLAANQSPSDPQTTEKQPDSQASISASPHAPADTENSATPSPPPLPKPLPSILDLGYGAFPNSAVGTVPGLSDLLKSDVKSMK